MLNNLLLAESGSASSIVWLVILIGLVIVMLVLPTFTQKKRIKAYEEMKSRLSAGDKVQTIGGIVGKIVRIKESNGVQTVFIETGDKNNKVVVEFDINAIAGVVEGLNNPNANAPQVEKEDESTTPEEVDVSVETEETPQETPAEEKKPAKKAPAKKAKAEEGEVAEEKKTTKKAPAKKTTKKADAE